MSRVSQPIKHRVLAFVKTSATFTDSIVKSRLCDCQIILRYRLIGKGYVREDSITQVVVTDVPRLQSCKGMLAIVLHYELVCKPEWMFSKPQAAAHKLFGTGALLSLMLSDWYYFLVTIYKLLVANPQQR